MIQSSNQDKAWMVIIEHNHAKKFGIKFSTESQNHLCTAAEKLLSYFFYNIFPFSQKGWLFMNRISASDLTTNQRRPRTIHVCVC